MLNPCHQQLHHSRLVRREVHLWLSGMADAALCIWLCCTGVTTWLPWAAELELALVDSFAALGFPADFHRSFSGDIAPSLALWALLLNTALVHSNSFPIHPATWLAPPLLRLAHHALLRVRTAGAGHSIVLRTALKAAASNLSWRMHPHLCLWVTGSPADAVLSRTAAKALRQVGPRLVFPNVICQLSTCW